MATILVPVGIIQIIIGIIYLISHIQDRRLTTKDYPGVDEDKFFKWKRAELKATNIVLWSTWIAFLIEIPISQYLKTVRVEGNPFMAWFLCASTETARNPMSFSMLIMILAAVPTVWLCCLIVATVYGSKAKKLRTAAGIE